MAKSQKGKAPPSVEELIRQHSKARVVYARKVSWLDTRITGMRQITDADVIEQMVSKYA